MELCQKCRSLAELIVRTQHADLAAVPTVGQHGTERVHAPYHLVGYVVGLHLGSLGVLGESGRQLQIADGLAVEVCLA